jgi:hypothetical protein
MASLTNPGVVDHHKPSLQGWGLHWQSSAEPRGCELHELGVLCECDVLNTFGRCSRKLCCASQTSLLVVIGCVV